MSHQESLRQVRIDKMDAWKQKLGYAYATKFDRTHTATEAQEACNTEAIRDHAEVLADCQSNIMMCGRIIQMRDMGKLAFIRLQDATGEFQISLIKDVLGDEIKEYMNLLDIGDFCGFSGEFFHTKKGEPSLMVTTVTPLAKALLPLPEKFHGLTDREACYRQRYLDLISNQETYDRFRVRTKVIKYIREYLDNLDFEEVETRVLQSVAGGAMAKVFETHHNALDEDMVLRIATELDLKMIMVGRYERVYEIGKDFRNEGIDPSHLQEFTMLEWYAAYKDIHWNMDRTEEMLREVIQKSVGTMTTTVYDKEDNPVEVDWGQAWPRITFADLVQQYAGVDVITISEEDARKVAVERYNMKQSEADVTSRWNLLDYIYKKSARENIIQPTFVMNYPTELKPLAIPNGDGTSSCFQLVVAGWEIVNAYGELVNPLIQRKLLEQQADAKDAGDDEAMSMNSEFLTAMEHGMPPMTGTGIGIERLVCMITGQKNLKDTVFFPMMKTEKVAMSNKKAEELYRSKHVVVIADPSKPAGPMANALAQLGISIGGHSDQKLFDAKVLHDADNNVHYTDCFYGMANLAGTQEQMHYFMNACHRAGIQVFDFSEIMRKAHTDKQMQEGYGKSALEDIDYYAVGALVPAEFEKEWLAELELYGA